MSEICFVFKRMGIGGAELRTKELATHFPQHHFTFATTSLDPGELDAELKKSGHRILPFGYSPIGLLRFMRFLTSRRVDVVHSNLGISSGLVLLVAAICGVRVRIAHFRSDGVGGRRSILKSFGLRVSSWLIFLTATDILGVAPGSLTYGWREGWRRDPRCQVVPNTIDVARLSRPSPKTPEVFVDRASTSGIRLCSIGRAEPSKRRHLAIQTWEVMRRRRPADLFLVGGLTTADQDLCRKLQQSVRHHGSIHSESYVENAASVLPTMDVLLLTSSREGLPGVVLEALAAGTPAVATDLPGVRWIAENTYGVLRLGLDATPDEWADAIEEALSLDRDQIELSFAGSPFASKNVIRQLTAIWRGRGLKP